MEAVQWVPTGLLAALFSATLWLWRLHHKLDQRVSDIENEKKIREKLKEESVMDAILESYKKGV